MLRNHGVRSDGNGKPAIRARVTMADVAKAADVSKALVSRVLNKVESQIPIPQTTIDRIERIAREMNYVPSRSARSLKRGSRMNLIGVSIRSGMPPTYLPTREELMTSPDLPEKYHNRVIDEVVNYEGNFTVGMLMSALGAMDVACLWDLVILHRNEGQERPLSGTDLGLDLVDGLLYQQPTFNRLEYLSYARSGFPVVVMGHTSNIPREVSAVGIDNFKGSEILVNHLLSLGRRNLIGIWPYGRYVGLTEGRYHGFVDTMETNGLAPLGNYFSGLDMSAGKAYWLTKSLLENHPNVDGFLVGSNGIAHGVIYALKESGRKIPGDVSVVTFDDKPTNILESPSITALRIPFADIYSRSLNLLWKLIHESHAEPEHITLNPRLIIRESCGGGIDRQEDASSFNSMFAHELAD